MHAQYLLSVCGTCSSPVVYNGTSASEGQRGWQMPLGVAIHLISHNNTVLPEIDV